MVLQLPGGPGPSRPLDAMKQCIDALKQRLIRSHARRTPVKRLAWITLGLAALALSACAPTSTVRNDVVPTLISVTVPQNAGGTVVLQGRYFGDGFGGAADNSYVLVGADMNGDNGVQAQVDSWTPTR